MKNKTRKKSRAKTRRKVNCINLIIVLHQPAVTYAYIGALLVGENVF
jgi:hypothetical protein